MTDGARKMSGAVLAPLTPERERLFTILDLLETTEVLVERADLASELVASASRYEDAKARSLYPALEGLAGDHTELERARADQEWIRDALSEIRRRTRHVRPDHVYADDPEGFEEVLVDLLEGIRQHLGHEEEVLLPKLAVLDPEHKAALRGEVEHAVAHASSHPHAPEKGIARAVMELGERLEHAVRDESTSWHPGVTHLEQRLAEGEPEEPPAWTPPMYSSDEEGPR